MRFYGQLQAEGTLPVSRASNSGMKLLLQLGALTVRGYNGAKGAIEVEAKAHPQHPDVVTVELRFIPTAAPNVFGPYTPDLARQRTLFRGHIRLDAEYPSLETYEL